jgi:hypothetical protein
VVIGDDGPGDISQREHTILLWDKATGWARPIARQVIWSSGPESFGDRRVVMDHQTGTLCAVIRTPYVMEFNPGSDLAFVLAPDFVARFFNEIGYEHYRSGRCGDAEYHFRLAGQFSPGFDKALYNSACMLAIQGNAEGAIHYLGLLADLGTPEARAWIDKVDRDSDYNPVRQDPVFRTGLERVQGMVR